MEQVEPTSTRRKGLWATRAITAVTSAVTIALPATAHADPEVPTPVPPTTTAVAPPAPANPPPVAQAPNGQPVPGDPNAVPPPNPNGAPPPPFDPNAPVPPPPPDPNAGRITNAVGGFSYVLPGGWVESDASHLDYGSALLSKMTGPPPMPDQPPPVANDTRIVMGRLDQKLYASAEPNNTKAAVRLGSDMGEFFMPYPGTRINQDATPLAGANGISGSASFYEVKFSDASKPNGQIWTGVVGPATANATQRWFVVWLGTSNDPVDRNAAKALAESIQPWTPPAAAPPAGTLPGTGTGAPPGPAPGAPVPAAPAPAAPAAPAPAAPAPAPAPGAPAPAPGQAPAAEVTPAPTPTVRTLPTT